MKKLSALPLFFLWSITLTGQSFTPVKDEAALRKTITEANRNIQSIQCAFTQEKKLAMLSEAAVSNGRFYFKKEGKVRLEYMKPTAQLMVMNNGKMLMQDAKKTKEVDVHRHRIFRQLNDIIIGSVNGDLFAGNDFTSRIFETTNEVKIELSPVSKTLKNYLANIILILDKKNFTARRIEMNEPSGDATILSFSQKQINADLSDSLFVVK